MKIIPVLTEKSMQDAKKGKYTFWVPTDLTKTQIKKVINDLFAVSVVTIKTINYKRRERLTMARKKRVEKARKKTIVTLRDKQKIELFGGDQKK